MKITDYKEFNNPNSSLKASFIVHAPLIKKANVAMKIFQKADGSRWFGYPTQPYTNAKGEKKYEWLFYLDKDEKDQFEIALENALMNRSQEELPF